MTNDIRTMLLSSEVVASLSMEARIARAFTDLGWDAERSVYYTDVDTGKAREIDVRVSHVFDKPQTRKGIGAPIINLEIICECKNLKGSNVIFVGGKEPKLHMSAQRHWLGTDDNLRQIVLDIAKEVAMKNRAQIKALYDYATNRAYANSGVALRHHVTMPPPPVNLLARAFRETKSGKILGENSDEGIRSNPVWSAILSVLSSARAIRGNWNKFLMENVKGEDSKFYGKNVFARYVAFFLDVNLMRNIFLHPIVILNAKLWHLEGGNLEEINSARLFITNVDGSTNYIDLVSDIKVDEYIDNLVWHYSKYAKRSIARLWRTIDEIGWVPGEAEKELAKILGVPRKRSERKSVEAPISNSQIRDE